MTLILGAGLVFACGDEPAAPSAPEDAPDGAPLTPSADGSTACSKDDCRDPSTTDGVKGGTETDVDCGGANAPPCGTGKHCVAATDCESKVCGPDATCAAPSATDGVQNGTETDVDCGGGAPGSAPKCGDGKACKEHADCTSDGCAYSGKCVPVRSCAQHHGGDTCGPGEADATHESCCTTIDLPGAPGGGGKLDKYNITAGRFRQFVQRTNGDLRGYITAHKPAWWSDAWTKFLPNTLDSGDTNPDFTGVYQELGPYVHGSAGGANMGCFVNGIGARSFRLPDEVNTRMGDAQSYDQDTLDEKSMNCVTAYMIAAFCAWDGGKLPTRALWDFAWGTKTYPWGASPAPAGWPAAFESDATGSPTTPANGDPKRANWNYNYWMPAKRVGTDYTVHISAPGRFPTGNGPFGHADLAGNVFNFQELTGTTVNWSKTGSWQGHAIPFNGGNRPAANKYWATGGRCAR